MPTVTEAPAAASGTFTLGGDLTVHRLGFGAMRITGPGVWGEPQDHDESRRVLKRAVEAGVNFIDTADSYGPEVSERLIAEALYPYPKDVVIATKGGLYRTGPGIWPTDGRPEHLRKAVEGSLQRLKLKQIDLYQFHRPDPKVPFEESVGAIAVMREEGKIRHVGLSNVSTRQLQTAQRIVPIASVQNRYSLDDRDSEEVLKECERLTLAFIPWGPLGSERMNRPGGPVDWAAKRHGATAQQIVLAWLLQHSPVMLPIPGTSRLDHLEENLAAARIRLDREEMQELDRV
jgi:aryl-alcohol dehydrogenase-like predicted oxidoreductase